MALPTSGSGWDAIMARVNNPAGGAYEMGVRDDSNTDVLAYALAGARLDNAGYKAFVADKIQHMMSAGRNLNDVLAMLRNLSAYIISADLIDLKQLNPALDAQFRTWLTTQLTVDYAGGGGGGSVVSTQERKPNNFGTHAGADRVAAALYLGDTAELQAAADIWYGWATGDPAHLPPGMHWTGTSWQCDPARPAGIDAVGCSRDGLSLNGAVPEDQARCGEFSPTPCATNYIHGATDGMTLAFWLLSHHGFDAWNWGDRAALRQMQWKYSVGQPPYDGYRWQIPVIESVYGVTLSGNEPSATSTNFGFADWWAAAR
jgi:hypothetical protein